MREREREGGRKEGRKEGREGGREGERERERERESQSQLSSKHINSFFHLIMKVKLLAYREIFGCSIYILVHVFSYSTLCCVIGTPKQQKIIAVTTVPSLRLIL